MKPRAIIIATLSQLTRSRNFLDNPDLDRQIAPLRQQVFRVCRIAQMEKHTRPRLPYRGHNLTWGKNLVKIIAQELEERSSKYEKKHSSQHVYGSSGDKHLDSSWCLASTTICYATG